MAFLNWSTTQMLQGEPSGPMVCDGCEPFDVAAVPPVIPGSLKHDRSAYRVTWNPTSARRSVLVPSSEIRVRAPKLGGCSPSRIRGSVAEAVRELGSSSERIPVPLATNHYSGRFRLRIPLQERRYPAIEAVEPGVGFNRLACALLARDRRKEP